MYIRQESNSRKKLKSIGEMTWDRKWIMCRTEKSLEKSESYPKKKSFYDPVNV